MPDDKPVGHKGSHPKADVTRKRGAFDNMPEPLRENRDSPVRKDSDTRKPEKNDPKDRR